MMAVERTALYYRFPSNFFRNHSKDVINHFKDKTSTGSVLSGIDKRTRQSEVYLYDVWKNISELEKDILFNIRDIVKKANKKFNYDLDLSTINIQFTSYKSGDFYSWHCDDDINSFHKKHLNLRKLSLSIPLNDGYEGGEFETVYGTFNKAKPRLIKQEIGVGIIFPSWVQHQVKPVFSGTRYSIVSWISGPPWR